jgi:phospholipid transport system substrate-binding protein
VNGQWLIYNVQIENVSLVLNYRSQFGRILNMASYAELVQRLKGKLLELDVPPS